MQSDHLISQNYRSYFSYCQVVSVVLAAVTGEAQTLAVVLTTMMTATKIRMVSVELV
jgi:hypothetical protein